MWHLVLLSLRHCQHQGTPWCDLEAKQTCFVSDTSNNVNGLHTSLLVLMPTAYGAKRLTTAKIPKTTPTTPPGLDKGKLGANPAVLVCLASNDNTIRGAHFVQHHFGCLC